MLDEAEYKVVLVPLWRMTLNLTLDRVEVTLVCIFGRGPHTHQITSKSGKKLFVDLRTDGRTDTPDFSKSIRSSLDDLIEMCYVTVTMPFRAEFVI